MTLEQAYEARSDLRYVAFRVGTLTYVSLGYNTAGDAITQNDISPDDASAADWTIGEVVPGDDGQIVAIEER